MHILQPSVHRIIGVTDRYLTGKIGREKDLDDPAKALDILGHIADVDLAQFRNRSRFRHRDDLIHGVAAFRRFSSCDTNNDVIVDVGIDTRVLSPDGMFLCLLE